MFPGAEFAIMVPDDIWTHVDEFRHVFNPFVAGFAKAKVAVNAAIALGERFGFELLCMKSPGIEFFRSHSFITSLSARSMVM